jgi:hypothetical protein
MRRKAPGASFTAWAVRPGAGEGGAAADAGLAAALGETGAAAGELTIAPEAGAAVAVLDVELLLRLAACEAACLHCAESSSLCAFRHARILPPPDGTPAHNFCASSVQPARRAANADASSAVANGAYTVAQQMRNNVNRGMAHLRLWERHLSASIAAKQDYLLAGSRLGRRTVLLVVGIMNLRAMAIVTAAITFERLAPAGMRVARAIGFGFVGAGLILIAKTVGLG